MQIDSSVDDVEDRLRLLDFSDIDRRSPRDFWPVVERHLSLLPDAFYDRLAAIPTLAAKTGSQTEQLKRAPTPHWQLLFSGIFDVADFASAALIGRIHHRIGHDPFGFVAGYGSLAIALTDLARIEATVRDLRGSAHEAKGKVNGIVQHTASPGSGMRQFFDRVYDEPEQLRQ